MRVWIDMSNSPHPLLFAPVAQRLEADGHEVLVTARDNAQTVALTLERWQDATIFGGESPSTRAAKVGVLGRRIAELRRWARAHRPDVALSHNSYSQIVAAASLRIPAVTAMDFEHQPANHLAFRAAKRVLLPEALASEPMRRQGASARKVRYYPGFKEELYVADFEPDLGVEETLGLRRDTATALVVARTPPSRATYHQFGNPLFEEAVRTVCAQEHVVLVVLPRHHEQREALRALNLERLVLADRAIDSRSLMYRADLVLGAGGTMTREAALLGVPVYSLFAGKPAAVDAALIERGLLRRLERASDLAGVTPRPDPPTPLDELARRGDVIQQAFVEATLDPRRSDG